MLKWDRICKQIHLNGSSKTFIIGQSNSLDEFILDSIQNGDNNFVIAGGDGSVNYFVNRCINLLEPDVLKQIKLGAVGIGSSNDFHKPFQSVNVINNIPYKLNFNEAVLRDVGCIKYDRDGQTLQKYFLINASIGITAEGNHFFNYPDRILQYLKKINTPTAINYAVIKNILTFKNFRVIVEVSNEFFTANVTNLGIIKSPYFTGSLRYQSDPLLDDGLFDIHLYQSLSKIKLLKLFYHLSKGKPDSAFNKKFFKTSGLKISSEKEFAVEFDGEIIKTNRAEFSIIPGLIKVCIS